MARENQYDEKGTITDDGKVKLTVFDNKEFRGPDGEIAGKKKSETEVTTEWEELKVNYDLRKRQAQNYREQLNKLLEKRNSLGDVAELTEEDKRIRESLERIGANDQYRELSHKIETKQEELDQEEAFLKVREKTLKETKDTSKKSCSCGPNEACSKC